MRGGALIALLLLPVTATAATISRAEYLMGTVCEITVESAGEAQLSEAFAEARRVERLISTWREDSELWQLNRSGRATVSAETRDLLQRAVVIARSTGGTFNPLMRPLIDAWKTRSQGQLPDPDTIAAGVRRSQLSNLNFPAAGTVVLRDGAQVEEGGFGKGYAINRVLLRITTPTVVVNFGGQLFIRGDAEVAIADPSRRGTPVVRFRIRNTSLSTSSGAEKTFTVEGRRFSHIIDPRTGEALPPRGSASVIASDAFTADALSTALYVMGPDEGLRWAEDNGVAALFITADRHIRLSAAFREYARSLVVTDDHFTVKD